MQEDQSLNPEFFIQALNLSESDQIHLKEPLSIFSQSIQNRNTDESLVVDVYKQLAQSLLYNENTGAAVVVYKHAATLKPLDSEIHHLLGNCLCEVSRYPEAVHEYQQSISLNACSAIVHVDLALALRFSSQINEALMSIEQALQIDNECGEAHILSAMILYNQGKSEEVKEPLKKAKEWAELLITQSSLPRHHLKWVFILWMAFDDDDGNILGEMYEAYFLNAAKSMYGYLILGSIYLCRQDYIHSEEMAREAIKMNASYDQAYTYLAYSLDKQGRLHEAVDVHKEAININPQNDVALFNLGYILTDLGRLDEAVDAYKASIKINPNNDAAFNDLGYILSQQGKLSEAIEAYKRSTEINPQNVAAIFNLGDTLDKMGRIDEAIDAYNAAIEIDPSNINALRNLGDDLAKKGQLQEAIELYNKAIQIDPNSHAAYHSLGSALESLGKSDEAVVAFKTAIQIDPNNDATLNNLANTLHTLNRLDEAIETYRAAIKINPKVETAYRNLAATLYTQGRLDEAADTYRAIIKLNPQNGFAVVSLGEILAEQSKLDEVIDVLCSFKPKDTTLFTLNTIHRIYTIMVALSDPHRVISILLKAVRKYPNAISLHYCLGELLLERRDLEAVKLYRKAIIHPSINKLHAPQMNSSILITEQLKLRWTLNQDHI